MLSYLWSPSWIRPQQTVTVATDVCGVGAADGTAVVVFLVCKGLLHHEIDGDGLGSSLLKISYMVVQLVGGGLLVGVVMAQIVYLLLRTSRELDATVDVTILIVSTFLVFYLAEHWFGASGESRETITMVWHLHLHSLARPDSISAAISVCDEALPHGPIARIAVNTTIINTFRCAQHGRIRLTAGQA